jgi:glyoxylase-like metal-dependent hydrolase (beta-lactamase superfamily II)
MAQETYRLQVGSIEVIVVADAKERIVNYEGMFPHLDADAVTQAAQPYVDADGALIGSLNCAVIKTGGQTLLVDTGMGAATKPATGHLMDNLESIGIAPEDIDTVIITHAHGDHVNGLVNEAGELIFANANYVMWGDEWAYWTNEENLANMLEYRVATVQNKLLPLQHKLTLVTSEDQEIAPGICPMPTPGHTPGHMALMIESDGERLLHMVDVSHLLFQPQNPDWSPMYDSLPELAAETRRRIFEKAAAEDLLVLAYHHPFPGLGYFRKQGEAFVWETKED